MQIYLFLLLEDAEASLPKDRLDVGLVSDLLALDLYRCQHWRRYIVKDEDEGLRLLCSRYGLQTFLEMTGCLLQESDQVLVLEVANAPAKEDSNVKFSELVPFHGAAVYVSDVPDFLGHAIDNLNGLWVEVEAVDEAIVLGKEVYGDSAVATAGVQSRSALIGVDLGEEDLHVLDTGLGAVPHLCLLHFVGIGPHTAGSTFTSCWNASGIGLCLGLLPH